MPASNGVQPHTLPLSRGSFYDGSCDHDSEPDATAHDRR